MLRHQPGILHRHRRRRQWRVRSISRQVHVQVHGQGHFHIQAIHQTPNVVWHVHPASIRHVVKRRKPRSTASHYYSTTIATTATAAAAAAATVTMSVASRASPGVNRHARPERRARESATLSGSA